MAPRVPAKSYAHQEQAPAKVNAKDGEILPPIKRSTRGLTQALFDEIEMIRSGKSTPTRANAMGRMAGAVVEAIRLEMEMERHAERHRDPNNPDKSGPLEKDLD